MQSIMRHKRCLSLENVDVEQQQQLLFYLSVFKLQQMRQGVDPRLLHFVLINNSLRSLKGHMLHFDDEDCDGGEGGGGDDDGGGGVSSDQFIYNTFKNGSLSPIPLSPPTPAKTVKTDGGFSDQSPLVEYLDASPGSIIDDSMVTTLESERVQPEASLHKEEPEAAKEEYGGGEVPLKDRRLLNGFTDCHGSGVHLGKRSRDHFAGEEEEEGEEEGGERENPRSPLVEGAVCDDGKDNSSAASKRPCKSPGMQKGLHNLNNLYVTLELDPLPPPVLPSSPTSLTPPHFHHHAPHQSHSEDSEKESLTPSPIDFANVDPSIYDFDTAVLVDTPGGLASCADHAPHSPSFVPPPHHISITVSMSSMPCPFTTQSSLQSYITICSPSTNDYTSFLEATPQAISSMPIVMSSQVNGCRSGEHDVLPLCEQKVSVLSADSMVMTTTSDASTVTTTTATGVKVPSCSLQALMHGGLVSEDKVNNESSQTTMSNGTGGALSLSPEGGIEPDDELDHIVDFLMT